MKNKDEIKCNCGCGIVVDLSILNKGHAIFIPATHQIDLATMELKPKQ